jgi:hypothetical protein
MAAQHNIRTVHGDEAFTAEPVWYQIYRMLPSVLQGIRIVDLPGLNLRNTAAVEEMLRQQLTRSTLLYFKLVTDSSLACTMTYPRGRRRDCFQ